MGGIYYLKSAYDVIDESVVYSFLENPYWQYHLGYEYFQHSFPFDSATLERWSQRNGS